MPIGTDDDDGLPHASGLHGRSDRCGRAAVDDEIVGGRLRAGNAGDSQGQDDWFDQTHRCSVDGSAKNYRGKYRPRQFVLMSRPMATQISRRDFLAAAGAAPFAATAAMAQSRKIPIGIELYSVRD